MWIIYLKSAHTRIQFKRGVMQNGLFFKFMSCYTQACCIKSAYSSHDPSFTRASVIFNFDVSIFCLQIDKWEKMHVRKSTFAESFHTTVLHRAIKAEQRRKKGTLLLKVGGLGCHSMVTFCVERHYDNEHSSSVVCTLPFNVLSWR